MNTEETIKMLTERVIQLEKTIISLKEHIGAQYDDDLERTILETKLASALQSKPLLTRDELIKSLNISGSLLDKWMKPMTEEDIIKGRPDFSKIAIKKGNRTWFPLAEVKHIFRSQLGEEGWNKHDLLLKNGGMIMMEDIDVYKEYLKQKKED